VPPEPPAARPLIDGLPFDDAWIAERAFSPQGVDRTLILAALRRTPAERLEALEIALRGLAELRSGIPTSPRR
jgi:hypothetical protein